ncbi:MAG: hypothetical protein K2X87_04285 [Gemmataceae bacterium]|nr:hypothetical protein [Gemmataceae bacterium]
MATATVSRLMLDADILIFGQSVLAPMPAAAVAAVGRSLAAGWQLCVSRQILREYLAGMTRPGAFTGTVPVPVLIGDVRRFQNRFTVVEDGPDVTDELLNLFARVPCGGKQVHDANIAATMIARSIPNLLTRNVADFTRIAPAITVIPL